MAVERSPEVQAAYDEAYAWAGREDVDAEILKWSTRYAFAYKKRFGNPPAREEAFKIAFQIVAGAEVIENLTEPVSE